MDCFDCKFISMDDLVYLIAIFWLVSWFIISCSASSKGAKKPNENISTEWTKVLSIVWKKILFYTEVKFVINNLFGKVFQASGVKDLKALLSAKLRC